MPTYVVRLDSTVDATTQDRAEERLREISNETGSGEVRRMKNSLNISIDISEDAVERVRSVAGVKIVEADVQFYTLAPSMTFRPQDYVNRTIMFDVGLSEAARDALLASIGDLARQTGNGFVRVISDELVIANLGSRAAIDVASMTGVAAVEDERGVSTPKPCGGALD